MVGLGAQPTKARSMASVSPLGNPSAGVVETLVQMSAEAWDPVACGVEGVAPGTPDVHMPVGLPLNRENGGVTTAGHDQVAENLDLRSGNLVVRGRRRAVGCIHDGSRAIRIPELVFDVRRGLDPRQGRCMSLLCRRVTISPPAKAGSGTEPTQSPCRAPRAATLASSNGQARAPVLRERSHRAPGRHDQRPCQPPHEVLFGAAPDQVLHR
jgi:hypothetical protein